MRNHDGLRFLAAVFFALSFSANARAALPPVSQAGKNAYVHLFEWKWSDIALECENFLGPMGYTGVQISPPNEHVVLPGNPWYERYQPVTYKLTSRSGTREELVNMVKRCKAVGVEIYADALVNHMAGVNKTGKPLYGIAGSPYFDHLHPGLYGPGDFHYCGKNGDDHIINYNDRWEVQNCNLAWCADLKTEDPAVREKIAGFLNDLLDTGVAGFRIDAAKHVPPAELQDIFSRVRKPFYAYQEVIDFGHEPIRAWEYFPTGDVTEFRFSSDVVRVFREGKLDWFVRFGEPWGYMSSGKAVVFIDNHDSQRSPWGMEYTHVNPRIYTLVNIFMLAWPYGHPQVMSSYRFKTHEDGPPAFADGSTKPVWSAGAAACGPEWVCEHRWPQIARMTKLRLAAAGQGVNNWWSNGNNQIAFSRGNKAFIAINRESATLDREFETGLPVGDYCNVTGGNYDHPAPLPTADDCSNTDIIKVGTTGRARITVPPMQAVALHVAAKQKR